MNQDLEYLRGSVWIERPIFEEAEIAYYEARAKASRKVCNGQTPLADEVAKARQRLIECRDLIPEPPKPSQSGSQLSDPKNIDIQLGKFENLLQKVVSKLNTLEERIVLLEKNARNKECSSKACAPSNKNAPTPSIIEKSRSNNDDDDIDLFGSDSDDDNEAVAKLKQERLAEYNLKKSKKPALIAKSNLLLDVKVWDTDTDMKEVEKLVRSIKEDGLLWGASRLVNVAYNIFKLQITCVVEDEKISIDWLTEKIEEFEDFVQSVDVVAFNKI